MGKRVKTLVKSENRDDAGERMSTCEADVLPRGSKPFEQRDDRAVHNENGEE